MQFWNQVYKMLFRLSTEAGKTALRQ